MSENKYTVKDMKKCIDQINEFSKVDRILLKTSKLLAISVITMSILLIFINILDLIN